MFTLPLAQAAAAAQGASQQGSPYSMLITMAIIFAIFYFIMIRPQQRKEKERRKTIDTMHAGKKVVFSGGIMGTVAEVKENTFIIEVASGVKIEVAKGAVSQVLD